MGLLNRKSTPQAAAEKTVSDAPKKARTKKAVEKSPVSQGATKQGSAFRVLLKPILSEKAALQESRRSYVFAVVPSATKTDIKKAVFQVYGVTPLRIRTLRFEGKTVRFGATMGRRSDWKKAIVTLKEGESIRIHEGV